MTPKKISGNFFQKNYPPLRQFFMMVSGNFFLSTSCFYPLFCANRWWFSCQYCQTGSELNEYKGGPLLPGRMPALIMGNSIVQLSLFFDRLDLQLDCSHPASKFDAIHTLVVTDFRWRSLLLRRILISVGSLSIGISQLANLSLKLMSSLHYWSVLPQEDFTYISLQNFRKVFFWYIHILNFLSSPPSKGMSNTLLMGFKDGGSTSGWISSLCFMKLSDTPFLTTHILSMAFFLDFNLLQ